MEVGKVSVRAWPDTREFRSDLLRDLEKIEKSVKATIKVVADSDGLTRSVSQAVKVAEAAAGEIDVQLSLIHI